VLFDEHGIGGSGDYFGDNDAHLGIINVFYHEASGGKYVPRAVLFVLKPGVIDALRASPLGCLFRPGILVGKTGATMKYLRRTTSAAANNGLSTTITPPCSAASFEVNSEPHTGARPSVRLCVGPELARCVHNALAVRSPARVRMAVRKMASALRG
jgi:hypothetical protein